MHTYNIIGHIESLVSGEPASPECARWLAEGFKRHLQGENLAAAMGLNQPGHGGIRDAVLRKRWRNELGKAVALLDQPEVSSLSIAKILAAEFSRLGRSRRPPQTKLEKAVHAARLAYSKPATTEKALWVEVEKLRSKSK